MLMKGSSVDESQRTAARVAGFAYLITFAIVVYVNFGIHARLITGSSAAETARNIQAHELLFRIGIAADLIYCAGVVVLVTALYVVLRPVNRGLALLAALWRLIWVLMWLQMTLNLFDSLRLLSGAKYLGAFETDRLQDLARFYLGTSFDYYYVALLFGGLASTACAYLWLKSRYIPRGLAAFGLVTSAFAVACTLIFFVFPGFDKIITLSWFDVPMGLFDIALSLWLLFKGLVQPRPGEAQI
jgi:hypothetical protein